jgi:hypothetical protein
MLFRRISRYRQPLSVLRMPIYQKYQFEIKGLKGKDFKLVQARPFTSKTAV